MLIYEHFVRGDCMLYKENKRAEMLFPNQKEGYKNIAVLDKKIKLNLPEKDYAWAKKFCLSIINHENYELIKKELKSLAIIDLKQNHQILQNILEHPLYSEYFLTILKNIIEIIAETKKISASIIGISYTEDSIIKQKNDLEYYLDLIGYLLFQENNIEESIIIELANDIYDKRTEWAKDRLYLKEIIDYQKKQLPKLILERYQDNLLRYKMKKGHFETRTINDHITSIHASHLHGESRKSKIKRYN